MKIAYVFLIFSVVFALHEHYKHLDLEYIAGEARRVAQMDKDGITQKVSMNKQIIDLIKDRYENIYKAKGEEGMAKWKEDYENEYVDDVDRALVAQSLCRHSFGDIEECNLGIEWDHDFDTRDETLLKEFRAEVEEVIKKNVDKVNYERSRRTKADL